MISRLEVIVHGLTQDAGLHLRRMGDPIIKVISDPQMISHESSLNLPKCFLVFLSLHPIAS